MSKYRKYRIIGCLIGLFILHPVFPQCVTSVKSFGTGEKLNYQALYTWGFIWIHAANFQFSVGSQKVGSQQAYAFQANASSLSAFDWFFKVRDSFKSLVTTEKFLPVWFDQNTSEGGFEVRQTYTFSPSGNRIYHHATITRHPEIHDTVVIPPCTFDILSTMYYCRNIRFNQYKVNDRFIVNTLIDGKLYPIHCRFLGKEVIPGLHHHEKYSCYKLEATAVESTNFKEGETITIWFTDDDNCLPVLAEGKVVVGSVKAYLDSFEGLKNPLKSRIISR